MDRKVLTLEEIISLDRRPTLQEVVDLAAESVEDYAQYLYHLGVLKYIPESLYKYEENDAENQIYEPLCDALLHFANPNIDYGFTNESYKSIDEINEMDNELIKESLDDGYHVSICESGYVTKNNKKYYYVLRSDKRISIYDVNEYGNIAYMGSDEVYY